MPAVSGYFGRVRLAYATESLSTPAANNNQLLTCTRWTVNWKQDLPEVTNFESGKDSLPLDTLTSTFGVYHYGVRDLDVSMDVIYDSTRRDQLGAPQAAGSYQIAPGYVYYAQLFYDKTRNVADFTIHMRVETVNLDQEVRGVFKYTVSGKATGEFNNNNTENAVTAEPPA